MRVAIVRLTSLGDIVHTLPIADALRRHQPAARIVWIAEERERALLVDNPAVDEVVAAPTRRWRSALRTRAGAADVLKEWKDLWRRLRALRLDVAIDVQGLLKSTHFLLLAGAPKRIGFGWSYARDPLTALFTTHHVTPPTSAVHVVQQNLSLLTPLGISATEPAFPLPRLREADARAQTFLAEHGHKPRERLVVLLPATRGVTKQWPPVHYRELTRRLVRTGAARVLLLGGPGEQALLAGIAGGLDGDPILSVDGSIPELVGLLRLAHLAIGNDTGPLHLAAALGIPTIGLFGPTLAERNGPYGPRVRTIQSPTARMPDISVDTAFEAVMEWLI